MRNDIAACIQSAGSSEWVVFEQDGRLAFGELVSRSSKNVCLASGEQIPIGCLWLQDAPPSTPALLAEIERQSAALSADTVWQAAAGQAQSIGKLADAVFGEARKQENVAQELAIVQVLLASPFYFYRRKDALVPHPAALLEKIKESYYARERRSWEEAAMREKLTAGELPPEIRSAADTLLYSPEKSTSVYRVLRRYAGSDKNAFARFFIAHGVLRDARDYFAGQFHHSRIGWESDDGIVCPPPTTLPEATEAFSIDDAGTVEIDDAFSVSEEENGDWRIGIHIAVPALCECEKIAAIAKQRLISVYFPDEKYPMLPADAIAQYSLTTERAVPALSLYLRYTPATQAWRFDGTVLEAVRLYESSTPEQVNGKAVSPRVAGDYAKLAQVVEAVVRTRPDLVAATVTGKPDFKISANPPLVALRSRDGAVHVVAVLMRLVNGEWATRLVAARRGGLYRLDGATKSRLKRSDTPYMWLSSPLRRYVDLINQRMLLSLMGIVPSFNEHWYDLASAFDRQYAKSRFFQRLMDRHWALRALQENETIVKAVYAGNNRLMLNDYPLAGVCSDVRTLADGAEVSVRVAAIDFVAQSVTLELAQ